MDRPRLPNPGGDDGEWGDILNEFLLVAHGDDGGLKVPFEIGSGLVQVNTTGRLTVSPISGDTALSAHSSDDDVDTLQVIGVGGNVAVALKPNGLYAKPTQPSSVGLFLDASALDGSSLLLDFENGGSVFTVNIEGGTTISPVGDTLNLALRPSGSQTNNLQEWQDTNGSAVAWIDAYGTPGGTLDGLRLTGWMEDGADPANVNSAGGGLITGEFRAQRPGSATMFIASEAWGGIGSWLGDGETFVVYNQLGENGKVLEMISAANPLLGFYSSIPVTQQTATDGDSLVGALQAYGLLDGSASWNSHAVTTDHDFFITGDGTLPITATSPGVGFGVETANQNAHIELASPVGTGTAYIDLTVVGTDASARVAWDANVGAFTIATGGHTVSIHGDRLDTGGLPVTGLPTSDPHIAGALWNSGGTPTISAG